MPTDVQICNMALARLGHDLIETLEDPSRQGELCAMFYETCRDEVLRMHRWNFATKTVQLARSTSTPPLRWGYAYDYPTDCMKVIRVDDQRRVRQSQNRIPFEVIHDTQQNRKLICCDDPELKLVYRFRNTNTSDHPAEFVSALAWRLAMELAMPLTKKPDVYALAESGYQRAIVQATSMNLNEEQPNREPVSEFESDRGGVTGFDYRSPNTYWR